MVRRTERGAFAFASAAEPRSSQTTSSRSAGPTWRARSASTFGSAISVLRRHPMDASPRVAPSSTRPPDRASRFSCGWSNCAFAAADAAPEHGAGTADSHRREAADCALAAAIALQCSDRTVQSGSRVATTASTTRPSKGAWPLLHQPASRTATSLDFASSPGVAWTPRSCSLPSAARLDVPVDVSFGSTLRSTRSSPACMSRSGPTMECHGGLRISDRPTEHGSTGPG